MTNFLTSAFRAIHGSPSSSMSIAPVNQERGRSKERPARSDDVSNDGERDRTGSDAADVSTDSGSDPRGYETDDGSLKEESSIRSASSSPEPQEQNPQPPQRLRQTHRRSLSQPFNTDRADLRANRNDDNAHALPTLSHLSQAGKRHENCWSEPNADRFSVRGPEYFSDRNKVTSGQYLLRARGCDLFVTDHPEKCVIGKNVIGAMGGNLRKESTLCIRLTFPWGLLVQYYSVPEKLAPFMRPAPHPSTDELSTSEKTLANWLMGDKDYKNQRLKLIPFVTDGPWGVKRLVTGKPALIGKKLPVSYTYTPPDKDINAADFLVCELDIGNSSKTAKRIVSVCRRYMSALTADIGFVIQAETEEELPEQMMGCIRMHKLDAVKAASLDE